MKPALRFVGLLAGLGCFLAGCAMVGPDYKPPTATTAKVATQWLEYEDPRLQTNAPVEPQWWKQAFQDPVLDQLIAKALADNLTLRSAALRVLQARQQLLIAQGNLYPQEQFIGATAGAVGSGAGGGPSGVYGINFNVNWEIDVWGRIRRQIETVSAAYDVTLSSYDGIMVSLVGQVAQTYLLIRTTEQRLAVARTNVTYQEESVRISQAKLDAGEVSSLDVDQGQTLLSNTRASVALLDQSVQQFKIALAMLLGELPQDLPGDVRKPGPIPAVSPVVAVGMPQDLIRRRPDIRTAERKLAAQSSQIGYAVSDLYPHFGFSGLIGSAVNTATGQEFAGLFNMDNVTYSYGGVMRWNIFNYGRIKNNIRLQDATFQQLLEDYRQTVLLAQGDVESRLAAFLHALVQLKELQQAADSAQRAADVSMEQYQDGMVDFNTVVSTLRALLGQQDQLASIQGTVAADLVDVYRSLGGGWEIRQAEQAGDIIPEATWQELSGPGRYWKMPPKDK